MLVGLLKRIVCVAHLVGVGLALGVELVDRPRTKFEVL